MCIRDRGLKINSNNFKSRDDLIAKLSGFIAAIVFGVISEKINITRVSRIDPNRTFPPKKLIIIIVTIADARMFAKLLPIKIVDNNKSGFCSSLRALFAPLCGFLERFFNLILLAAIIPVSDPEKNPLRIKRPESTPNKRYIEYSSCIY